MQGISRGFCAGLLLLAASTRLDAITPSAPGAGDVAFTINAAGVGAPISPLIYGVNNNTRPAGLTGIRLGGNRYTGYNWETNNSNAGSDYFHVNDGFLVNRFPNPNSPPGEAVRRALDDAAELGAATFVSLPLAGFVAGDDDGPVLPGQAAPSARWREVRNRKSSVYPGEPLSLTPNLNDGFVFNDEFVNWVESNRQNGQEVSYLLDNEPGLWDGAHPRLWGTTNPTFAEIGERSIATASTIKDVAPDAKVLGGVTFGWTGAQFLHEAPDFNEQVPADEFSLEKLHFNRWLLETVAEEEQRQGRVLVDALDVHWYPEARGGGVRITAGGHFVNTPEVVEARVQAPRSLWDPGYIEDSFITNDILGGTSTPGVNLLGRVRADIDELKPGTLISISEYNYGGGTHISGAIAQADVLGVFGREGVWNAAWWPIEGDANAPFVEAAFAAFRDFDGQGGRFGDLSVPAETSDIASSAVYASRSTENPDELVLVAINRTGEALAADISLAGGEAYEVAEVYQLTDAVAAPVFAGEFAIGGAETLLYELPAFSVSTIRLVLGGGLAGDYNEDGAVNAADFTLYRDGLPAAGFDLWAAGFGSTDEGPPAVVGVPEPATLGLLLGVLGSAACRRIRGVG